MKKNIKYLSLIVCPIFILSVIIFISLSKIPNRIYLNEHSSSTNLNISRSNLLKGSRLGTDKIQIKLLGLIPLKSIPVSKIDDLEIFPGGNTVGIKLSTKGVLVVGHSEIDSEEGSIESPARTSGIELGDVIVKINGEEIEDSRDLAKKVKNINNKKINIEFLRNETIHKKEINMEIEKDEYKLGLWVRDSTAGIGTLTFYDENNKIFGALGHPITDGDTNRPFIIKNGDLLNSTIISIRKGERGIPGELKGLFINEKDSIAKIYKNTESGIFGNLTSSFQEKDIKPMKVGFRNEIKEGYAQIITTIDEGEPRFYDIEIVKILEQEEPGPKSMVIKITDKELLEKTGGIVQGMSGSPIIQDDKIIGAVTHVLINKPDVGYGIYIEWMLKDADIIE
ncbi:SpoIVB peptidase [Clostridium sp.]|uniref:SpoIVB peptidase n=1 Tax=Clostridium sp. TaxID=1506 RepID=UPI00261C2684|nr:SpoIVB peptidase [Clostridium sp.]